MSDYCKYKKGNKRKEVVARKPSFQIPNYMRISLSTDSLRTKSKW